jgi:hypothetical protein
MTWSAADALEELRALRKGRGVQALDLNRRLGPTLHALCGTAADDSRTAVQGRVTHNLQVLGARLPDDVRKAVLAALAILPDAQDRFLATRLSWVGAQIERDARAVRRRMDEGLKMLAEEVVAELAAREAEPTERPEDAVYIKELYAVLRLDLAEPEARERRRVVARWDGVDRIESAVTLAQSLPTPEDEKHILIDVAYGGTLIDRKAISPTEIRYAVQLPEALPAGEAHEYEVVVRVPSQQFLRSEYVVMTRRRCDLMDLRVRFDRRRLPDTIWRTDRELYKGLREKPREEDRILQIDQAGDVHEVFRDLAVNLAHGLRWTRPAELAPRDS